MGREIRRVPPNWQHPKNARGYRPLHDLTIEEAMEQRREHPDWDDPEPDPAYYRPKWDEASATAFQIYETVSEGTPVSPVFVTREALIDYLVNDGGGMGIGGVPMRLSREAAERFADEAWAPSMTIAGGVIFQNAQMYEPKP